MLQFRWNAWNGDHATRHGVSAAEAEKVVRAARRPYPIQIAEKKWIVHGRGNSDRFIQVIYLVDLDGTLYIIHARPMTDIEKRRYRRRTR